MNPRPRTAPVELDRIDKANIAVRAYRAASRQTDNFEAVTDLLADLGHFCDDHDLPYLRILPKALCHWWQESHSDPHSPLGPAVTILIDGEEVLS